MIRVWEYELKKKNIGWEIEDRYEVGSYKDKDHMMEASDADIISWLKEEGHIVKGVHTNSFNIDGDGQNYLKIGFHGKPILEVTKKRGG